MVISSFIAALALAQDPTDRPRIRETLDNGVRILAHRDNNVDGFACAIFLSSKSVNDSKENHGRRHLLEHLISPGFDNNLDFMLESEGAFLEAKTMPDGMLFVIRGPKGRETYSSIALASLMQPRKFTKEQIAREAKIIEEESYVRPTWAKSFDTGWNTIFGDNGIDTFGNLETIKKSLPTQMERMHQQLFDPEGISIVIYGQIEPSIAVASFKSQLQHLKQVKEANPIRPVEKYVAQVRSSGKGDARLAVVPGVGRSTTTASVSLALYLSSQIEQGQVVFPFSYWPTAVAIWTPRSGGLSVIDEIDEKLLAENLPIIRAYGWKWVKDLQEKPEDWVAHQAVFLAQEPTLQFGTMENQVKDLTLPQVMEAWDSFRREKSIFVEGR